MVSVFVAFIIHEQVDCSMFEEVRTCIGAWGSLNLNIIVDVQVKTADLNLPVSGQSKQASKQAYTHTAQWSHTSVGLAQVYTNNDWMICSPPFGCTVVSC